MFSCFSFSSIEILRFGRGQILRALEVEDYSPLHKTALLLTGQFDLLHRCRIALGILGGVALPLLLALQLTRAATTTWLLLAESAVIVVLCLAGELIERRLFFVAVQPVQMPGGVPA